MFNKALEYNQVLSFTLGEPDFTASENVVEAGCRAIREGQTKYSANAGLLTLREAISSYLKRTEGLEYNPVSQIVVTPGAMGALYLALKTILNPGDEVIVSEPCWTNYIQQIQMCGGTAVSVRTDPKRGEAEAVRRVEMSRNVQSGNTQNLKSTVIQRSFPKWSVAERRKTAAASDQAAVCACAHSRYFAGGSPSGLRV